jgi:hypothetical protein
MLKPKSPRLRWTKTSQPERSWTDVATSAEDGKMHLDRDLLMGAPSVSALFSVRGDGLRLGTELW